MMDIIMLLVLAGCIGLVTLLVYWCQKQVERKENMVVLAVIVLLLGCYLVYALVHPEEF